MCFTAKFIFELVINLQMILVELWNRFEAIDMFSIDFPLEKPFEKIVNVKTESNFLIIF